MIVIPTAELRGSVAYPPSQLGADARLPQQPAGMSRAFARLGFNRMHLHDVDADFGGEVNETLLVDIARDSELEVIVSGGASSQDRVERLIDAGVSQVILGRGFDDDIDAFGRMADLFPGRLIVRADAAQPFSRRHGARQTGPTDLLDVANELAALPLGGLAVHGLSSGGFPGTPLRFVEDLIEVAGIPVFCRTEAANVAELRALERAGVAASLLGTSLFDGHLDAEAIARDFDS